MIIFISGLPGSGKTFLAKLLKEKLRADHFNTDTVRKEINKWDHYDAETKQLVYDLLLEKMKRSAAAGNDVIIEATFYKKNIRAKFLDAARQMNAPFYFISVKAEDETIRKRLQQPRADSQADYEVYLKLKKEYDRIDVGHLEIFSDKMKPAEMVEHVLEYLKNDASTDKEVD